MIVIVVMVVITVMVVVVIICRSRRRRDRAKQQTSPYYEADQKPLHGFLLVMFWGYTRIAGLHVLSAVTRGSAEGFSGRITERLRKPENLGLTPPPLHPMRRPSPLRFGLAWWAMSR